MNKGKAEASTRADLQVKPSSVRSSPSPYNAHRPIEENRLKQSDPLTLDQGSRELFILTPPLPPICRAHNILLPASSKC